MFNILYMDSLTNEFTFVEARHSEVEDSGHLGMSNIWVNYST